LNPRAKKNAPVMILGGSSNALSIARSLGRQGIDVYLSVLKKNCAYYTRHSKEIFPFEDKKEVESFWLDLLISNKKNEIEGAVIFPCNDDGVEFVAKHRSTLEEYYILDESIPEMMFIMLNKLESMELAKSIGIPVPKYLYVKDPGNTGKLELDFKYPLIIKPLYSHLFQKAFNGDKFFFVENERELFRKLEKVHEKNQEIIISELIPGPDTLLGSYYTYIDNEGNCLFHFTKRVIRRFPVNKGQATYHITGWNEEIAELGKKFFLLSGYRGLGNVEFKRDTRDGQLKLMECNPRFTACHELLTRCGMDIARIIYNHLVGLPVPKIERYKDNLTLWFPYRDYMAYKQLKEQNEITLGEWIKSLARKQVLPHFKLSDPMPVIAPLLNSIAKKLAEDRKNGGLNENFT